ncbi:hypothetical protein CTAYLR_005938 [Chrysophaeum taylorii]|uniref:adenosylmethionine decarboxylase n=1 Tax=Chrysophaeum taylorii TaxID=2483200 RepID=A0AAD7XHA9_9STRA|nr:hypothetical protein CTAYLR_005938 [Chrysophaeum taylorii]
MLLVFVTAFVQQSVVVVPRGLRQKRLATEWFEGPEKTLEVCFTPGVGDPQGCRALKADALGSILAEARCEILSMRSNAHLDAYVLSESSLFVYPHKVVIKTCGRTTLLRCLRRLLELATFTHLGLRLEWVGYSRKNYAFPDAQPSPHTSFHEELAYLKAHSHIHSAAFDGRGYLLGPITGDHWFVYVSDQCERPGVERTINVMMFDLDDAVRRLFYLGDGESSGPATGDDMTARSGLGTVLGHPEHIDAHAFSPCGYSMNALDDLFYTTVHVTPQAECSYASFETNTPLDNYDALVNRVLEVFRPGRAVVTLFADAHPSADCTTFDAPQIDVNGLGTYQRADFSSLHVEADCVCMMANYALSPDIQELLRPAADRLSNNNTDEHPSLLTKKYSRRRRTPHHNNLPVSAACSSPH